MNKLEQERVKFVNPKQTLLENSQKMLGGFELLAKIFPEVKYLNPQRKELDRNEFKANDKYATLRSELKDFLALAIDVMESGDTVAEMEVDANNQAINSKDLYNQNLLRALEATAELEKTYRSIDLFFQNSGEEKIDNVTFVNASIKQLCEDDYFSDLVKTEFRDKFDRMSLIDSYSNFVVPGYVGSKAALDKLATIAEEYRLMLITDFKDVGSFEEILEEAKLENLQGIDVKLANVIMTCNWIALRKSAKELGEEEPLHGPPSLALAGKMYKELLSQVAAGVKHGKISGAYGAHIDKYFSETQQLELLGLVPMLYERNELLAWSARTLHKSTDKGKMTYSVVRVFDWVAKVLTTYLNQEVFSNFKPFQKKAIEEQFHSFFNALVKNDIIKDYVKPTINYDGEGKITIDIEIEPFFPGRTFIVNLERAKDGKTKSKIQQN